MISKKVKNRIRTVILNKINSLILMIQDKIITVQSKEKSKGKIMSQMDI